MKTQRVELEEEIVIRKAQFDELLNESDGSAHTCTPAARSKSAAAPLSWQPPQAVINVGYYRLGRAEPSCTPDSVLSKLGSDHGT